MYLWIWSTWILFSLKTWLFWFWFCALRSFALLLIVAVLVCIASKARQVRGRAWAGQHLSRLDLLLLQRPGLPNNYDDDQKTIGNGTALPYNLFSLLPLPTLLTLFTQRHICMYGMDGSYPLRLLRLLDSSSTGALLSKSRALIMMTMMVLIQ